MSEAKISIEAKKAEAVERMKKLGIFPQTIQQFERDGKISLSEPPFGAFYWIEGEDLERVKEFEATHNALVFVGIRSYTEFGVMDCYLFVSDYEEEWPQDREGIKEQEVLAWVYNRDAPDCSEMGYVGIAPTPAAGLRRTW